MIHWGNVQEISIRPYKQIVYAQPGACPKKMTHINSYGTLTYKTDHLIPARRPDLIIINKRKRICKIVDFAVSAELQNKIWRKVEKKDKYLDLAKEFKKTVEHESNDCANCDWCVRYSNWRIIKGPGGLGSWRTGRDYPNDSIAEDGQNTETSPWKFEETCCHSNSEKPSDVCLMWKNSQKWIIIIIIIIINNNNNNNPELCWNEFSNSSI